MTDKNISKRKNRGSVTFQVNIKFITSLYFHIYIPEADNTLITCRQFRIQINKCTDLFLYICNVILCYHLTNYYN